MTLSCTSSEGDFSHFSQQEEEEEEEEDEVSYEDHAVMEEHGVAVARPPRSAATSAEVVVSGQAALDILEQVRLGRVWYVSANMSLSFRAADMWVEREHQISAEGICY